MSSTIALAWKEWRESRWVLAVAAVAFVALPLIAGLQSKWQYHQFDFAPVLWVTWAGGILGTLAGAFAAARDLRGSVAEFWQSRPVGIVPRVIVKYLVGVGTLLIACGVPLAIEAWTEWRDPRGGGSAALTVLEWLPLLWVVQYSLGFVCGTLTRRTGPAILLALALTLLGYCLPFLLPLPQEIYQEPSEWFPFYRGRCVAASLGLSLVLLVVSVAAVRWRWRVRAGQGLMYWSIGGVFVLLFASAAFQVASNLPVLQEVDLGPKEDVISIRSDGQRGMLVTRVARPHEWPVAVRSFQITSGTLTLGPEVPIAYVNEALRPAGTAWLPAHPDFCFAIREVGEHEPYQVELLVFPLGAATTRPTSITRLGLGSVSSRPMLGYMDEVEIYGAGSTLLALWTAPDSDYERATIDVTDPLHPRLIAAGPATGWRGFVPEGPYSDTFDYSSIWVGLPAMPGAPIRERLAVAIELAQEQQAAFADGLLAFHHGWNGILIYRLNRLSDAPKTVANSGRVPIALPAGSAQFTRAGRYDAPFVEQFLGGWTGEWGNQLSMNNDLLYFSSGMQPFDQPLARVAVLSLRDPHRPRVVGHFAAPSHGPMVVCALPDGRALIGGRKLYLVGPPPGATR